MAEKPFFVVPRPFAAVTSGNELAARPASHLGEFFYRGMVWESSDATDLWVLVDLGLETMVDFIGMMGANALSGTDIRVRLGTTQAEAEGGAAAYDSGAVDFISPAITREDERYHSHTELGSPVLTRWVRIDISGHTGAFLASMLVVGKKVEPVHYYEGQWAREVRDLGGVTFSRHGVPGVSEGSKLRGISFRLAWLTEDEMEETFSPIDERVGKTAPLFLAFDPEATIYRQRRTFFGFMEEQAIYTKRGYDRFEREFRFLSLF